MSVGKEKASEGRRFADTEKATTAARRVRENQERSEVRKPSLFVVRMPDNSPRYAWEVRILAAIVIARGEDYATEALARAAGERTLIAISSSSISTDG